MKLSLSRIQEKVESIVNNRNGRGYASIEENEKGQTFLMVHYVPSERNLIESDFEALKAAGFNNMEKNSMRIHIFCEYDNDSAVGFAMFTA